MTELRCNHVHLQHPHRDHLWEPQPGMEPVHCRGLDRPVPEPDPRELGLEWEDRIIQAATPQEVLVVVRHLLDERVTGLLERVDELEADLEELREEVSGERQQRRWQEAEDRGRREVLAKKLEKIRGYLDDCEHGFGDEPDTEVLREILE